MNANFIKNNKAIINILRVFYWLDKIRWESPHNYNFLNYFRNDLTYSERILTHWLTYITDRQMPYQMVWERGGYVFSELVYNFCRENKSANDVLSLFYKEDEKRFISITNKEIHFASRFITTDYRYIRQTLTILEKKYAKNIVKFVISFIERFKDKEDLLIRVACALYLLTYKLNDIEQTIETLHDENKFEKALEKFKENLTSGKKRLWCCIRDYKIGLYSRYFEDAIREIFKFKGQEKAVRIFHIWEMLPKEHIPLPGDVWNNNPKFREALFSNYLDFNNLPPNWQMPEIIREIYNGIKDKLRWYDDVRWFYPAQLDVTFDFVPRMCNQKLCIICPFGKNGCETICHGNTKKLCSVALITCGYITKCTTPDKCIIQQNVGKGLCKELIDTTNQYYSLSHIRGGVYCVNCKKLVIFGYPTPELQKEESEGKIILGGCEIGVKEYCPQCGTFLLNGYPRNMFRE